MSRDLEEWEILLGDAIASNISVADYGSGGIINVPQHDGSMNRYAVTNTHVIVNLRTQEFRGIEHNGQRFFTIYDANNNVAFARLASFIDHDCLPLGVNDTGEVFADTAILEIYTPEDVPQEILDEYLPHITGTRFDFTSGGWDLSELESAERPQDGRIFAFSLVHGDEPEIAWGDFNENSTNGSIEVFEDAGGPLLRSGYSGSFYISSETGLPVGQHASGYADLVISNGIPIGPIVEQVRTIDMIREMWGEVYTPAEETCEPGHEWQDNIGQYSGFGAQQYMYEEIEGGGAPEHGLTSPHAAKADTPSR